eukprot:gene18155-25537_t
MNSERLALIEIPQPFLCPVCLDLVKYPNVEHKQCETILCSSCIPVNKICPICRSDASSEQMKKMNRYLQVQYDELPFRCINYPDCTLIIKQIEIESHQEENCEYKKMDCTNDGCDITLFRKDLTIHATELCQFRDVSCSYCDLVLSLNNLENHYEVCPNVVIECSYCKSHNCVRIDMRKHKKVCAEKPLICPVGLCGFKCLRKELDHHYIENAAHHIKTLLSKTKRLKNKRKIDNNNNNNDNALDYNNDLNY